MRAMGEKPVWGRRISCEETERISMTITRVETYVRGLDDALSGGIPGARVRRWAVRAHARGEACRIDTCPKARSILGPITTHG